MILRTFLVFFLLFGFYNTHSQELQYEFLMEVEATLDKPIEIGNTPNGERTIFPFSKGSFIGPKIEGAIRNNGADWSLKVNKTTSLLDIRGLYTLRDGGQIYVLAKGYLHFNEDGTYYLRSTPIFETSAEGYTWLNHTVSVGIGELSETGVKFKIFTIK